MERFYNKLSRRPHYIHPIFSMKPWNILTPTLLLFALGVSACAPQPSPAPNALLASEVSPSPSAASLPSETPAAPAASATAWFPATSTSLPSPTFEPSPTVEPLAGVGETLFSDTFDRPAYWSNIVLKNETGNAALIDSNRLTLAANVPPVYLFSLRKDLSLVNFYAQMEVSVNRCQGDDEYGLLFRSGADFYTYRWVLTCDGRFRLERQRSGELIPLTDWITSGDVPPGAPASITLGIWASGSEYRFFINGRYQTVLQEPTFKTGTLGVFVSAASPAGMNISFSNLQVQSVSYLSPTPSPSPSVTPTPKP